MPGRPLPSQEVNSRIDGLMRAYDGEVPGASILALHEGRRVVQRAYGYANLEHRLAADSATNYRLASLTKQFTAAAVLLLVEEGRLSLDESIRGWLPSLPAAADRVTLRHLLTHTSGVLDYEDLTPASRRDPLHDADVLQLLESEDRTYFPPGTSYRYSNSGYALLCWPSPLRREWISQRCCARASSHPSACSTRWLMRRGYRRFLSAHSDTASAKDSGCEPIRI
jgi:CubicO group peptidase (beta-lactamase class C family)